LTALISAYRYSLPGIFSVNYPPHRPLKYAKAGKISTDQRPKARQSGLSIVHLALVATSDNNDNKQEWIAGQANNQLEAVAVYQEIHSMYPGPHTFINAALKISKPSKSPANKP
jgi:hypothetical protein